MNILHTCCVSLVASDLGLNPSPGSMNVGLNIHQMLSQKLYPLLSTTHEDGNTSCRANEAQSGFEPEPFVLWWNYLGCSGLMSEGAQVM